MQADQNAAVNVKARADDKELHRWLPFQKVKQILLERSVVAVRMRQPIQDSSCTPTGINR